MIAVEFFKHKKGREPAPEHPKIMVTEAAKRGLILLSLRHLWQRRTHPGAADRL